MNQPFELLQMSELEKPTPLKHWIWDGYLAPGQITLFTSVWKSGKTTLIAHLLAKRKSGGELAGRVVAPGVNAIVSEEPHALWQERHARLGFGPRDCFSLSPLSQHPIQGGVASVCRVSQKQADENRIRFAHP